MEKKTSKVIGTAAAIAAGAVIAAPATADPIPPAASYADLLQTVPDAAARLQAADDMASSQPRLIEAQYYQGGPAYHHHHHHHHNRRWYYQHGYVWNGRRWVLRPVHHHHHHHHHHY